MRLDLFLKVSRLCARRTGAQQLCDAGLISVNDNRAKSAYAIKPGDEVSIRRHNRITRVRVLSLPAARQVSRKEASSMYAVLSEEFPNHDARDQALQDS
jgi:ribosomal 50S subunit-recycling heat shock protein